MGDLPSLCGLIMVYFVNKPMLLLIEPDVLGIGDHISTYLFSASPIFRWSTSQLASFYAHTVASLLLSCPPLKCVQCGPSQ